MSESGKDEPIDVDATAYPLEAVQAAAYSFTDRAYARIEPGEGRTSVWLEAKDGLTGRALRGEFLNELLHQALRLKVSQANQKLREFIVTRALVSAQPCAPAGVVPPPAEPEAAAEAVEACVDCRDAAAPPPEVDPELEKEIEKLLADIEKSDQGADPLQVSVPWEEKHGKAAKDAAPAAPKAKAGAKRRKGAR